MNLFDKAIEVVAPNTALKRLHARKKLEIINTGYSNYGASRSKKSLIGWIFKGGSAKEDIEDNISVLRERSRDLYMGGAPLATGAIKTCRTSIVGGGLRLKSQIDHEVAGITEQKANDLERKIEKEFSLWADSPNCDLERMSDFYKLQQLTFINWLLSGDVLVTLPTTKRIESLYDLRIQLIEADRVQTPDKEERNEHITAGVEKNELGEVIAYHIAQNHPLAKDIGKKKEWVRVEAYGEKTGRRNILHILNKERIGQVRGVPFLAPVIESLKQLGRYTDAELIAAVISSYFTLVIQKDGVTEDVPIGQVMDNEEKVDAEDRNSIELGPGAILDLEEGETANPINPSRPNTAFDPFVSAMARQIGAALELPYELLLKSFTSSYSASRGALIEAWKMFKMYRGWLSRDFCQPIYEEWLAEAIAKGRIEAPGYFSDPAIKKAYTKAEWSGPTQGQLDPKKEVEAAELRVKNGFSTRTRETTELTGGDYDRNIKQRKAEEKALKEVIDLETDKKIQCDN